MSKSNEQQENDVVLWKEVIKEELDRLIKSGEIDEFSKDCLYGFRIIHKENDSKTNW